jgi:SNF2 family DNA or RNA helicase
MKKFYDGYDIDTPEGKAVWQKKVLDSIAPSVKNWREDAKAMRFRKNTITAAQRASLQSASKDGLMATINMEAAEEDLQEEGRTRYYAYQAATLGTQAHVGPAIEEAAKALELEMFIDTDGTEYYRLLRFGKDKIKRAFLPWQANGCAWGLSRMFGRIPQHPDADDEAKLAAAKLGGLSTKGWIITDMTGLGKTALLLSIFAYSEYGVHADKNGQTVFKMIFLEVPQSLLRQWAKEVLDYWPYFDLIIS